MIKKIIFGVLLIVLAFFSFALITQKMPIAGYSVYIVMTGSMKPAFNAGDVVITQKTDVLSLKNEDIITFNDPNIPGKIISHRIIDIKNKDGQSKYSTKGDANEDPDKWTITSGNILGKVVYSIPKLGFFISLSKSKPGFIIFILIPGLLIIFTEIWSLVTYVKRLEAKSNLNDRV